MSNFNTKYILPGDNKDEIISKINYNFNQVYFNSIGEKGPIGPVGATGIIGQAGRDGLVGSTGERASDWYFYSTKPSASISQEGDIWVDIGPTGGQEVYQYSSGGQWVTTGETLFSTGIFSMVSGISGPGGANEGSAVVINTNPGDKYLILSDNEGSTGDVNPNFSKVLIGTASPNSPLLGMDKTFYDRTGNISGFYWESSSASDYSMIWNNPGVTKWVSKETSISATGGAINVSGSSVRIKSDGSVGFTGAAASSTSNGTSGISSGSNILNITSSNLNLSSSLANFSSVSNNNQNVNKNESAISATSPSRGIYIGMDNTSGNSNSTERKYSLKIGADGGSVSPTRWESFTVQSRGDRFRIGSPWASTSGSGSGTSGITGGTLVRENQIVTTSFSTTANSKSYVQISPTSDVVIIKPSAGAGSVTSDGRVGRFYLSMGTNFSWIDNSTGTYRTIDVYVDSSTHSFGGIKSNVSGGLSGGPDYTEISDRFAAGSNPGNFGCKRIRLTFVSGRYDFFWEAYVDNNGTSASGTNQSGWIDWSIAISQDSGPGGGIGGMFGG